MCYSIKNIKNKNTNMASIKRIMDKNYLLPWVVNFFLLVFYLFWIQNSPLFASVMYSNIKADPFNWTVTPILMVPDYTKMPSNYKTIPYTDISSTKMIELPKYDPKIFGQTLSSLDINSSEYKRVLQSQLTYSTPYMSDYNRSYKEYTGSHLAIDIAAPKGTPVRSIANWVIVKAKNEPGWFGYNVVIRHEGVNYNWKIVNLYSGYAHMGRIYAKEWTKVQKWEMIGEVGSTWATSTGNHLHFQIDVEWAPFHPYWPFTTSEAKAVGLNFYSAINYGLGKDKALKYTIHPMNFVYRYQSDFTLLEPENNWNALTDISENPEIAVNVEEEEDPKKDDDTPSLINTDYKWSVEETYKKDIAIKELKGLDLNVEDNSFWSFDPSTTIASIDDFNLDLSSKISWISIVKNDDYVDDNEDVKKEITEELSENYIPFEDISKDSKYYEALKYLKENNLISGYKDWTFKPNNLVSRWEVAKMMVKISWVGASENTIDYFYDVKPDGWEKKYINKLVELAIVNTSKNHYYPEQQVSRVEWLKFVTKISKIDVSYLKGANEIFNDVSSNAWYYPYVVYAKHNFLLDFNKENFEPNKPLTRGELALMIYKIKTK